MTSVGLKYRLGELLAPLRDTGAVLRAVIVNFVLVLLVWVIIRLLPLGQANETALIILGPAAGAPLIVKLTQIAGGDVPKSATMLILLLPLIIVFMSVVLPLALPGTTISWTVVAAPLEAVNDDPKAKPRRIAACLSRGPSYHRAQAMTGALTPPLGTRSPHGHALSR